MSRKIGIIGMGNVGAAVAHGAIALLGRYYVFIDINEKKAEADAQDFKMPWQLPSLCKHCCQ